MIGRPAYGKGLLRHPAGVHGNFTTMRWTGKIGAEAEFSQEALRQCYAHALARYVEASHGHIKPPATAGLHSGISAQDWHRRRRSEVESNARERNKGNAFPCACFPEGSDKYLGHAQI
jgi:hypothetical protein